MKITDMRISDTFYAFAIPSMASAISTFLPRYLLLALRCRGWPQRKPYLLMPTLALGNALVVF